MADSDPSKATDHDLPESILHQLAAYDERLRLCDSSLPSDQAIELTNPALTKAIRALRDVLTPPAASTLSNINDSLLLEAQTFEGQPFEDQFLEGQPLVGGLLNDPHKPTFSFLSGSANDRFALLEELGSGGFGVVYRAYDTKLQRNVAIKFLRPELLGNVALRQRFLRESRAAARLNHPFIVRVLEVFESNENIWQVCELVDGAPLSEHIERAAVAPQLAARITRDLVDAIAHAHACQVIHRDIKPDNILIDRRPGEPLESATVRLTDFGLARLIDLNATLMSFAGMLVGTPRYMAPEQLTGNVEEHGVGTDIYAIGVVLYEMLSGRNPFDKISSLEERLALVHVPLPHLRKNYAHIPRDLATICHKCLEPSPERRYDSAVALRDDLDRFLRGEPTLARPLPAHEQLWRWSIRHRTAASFVGLLLFAASLVFALTLRNNSIYRSQNSELSSVNKQLAAQERAALDLADLAGKLKEDAIEKQQRFADLAWKKGIREAYRAWEERSFVEANELLAKLLDSHPEAASQVEWRLLRADVDKHIKVLANLNSSLNEVRIVPNSQLVAVAAEEGHVYLIDSATGEIIRTIVTGFPSLHALAVSHDGNKLAAGGSPDRYPNRAQARIYDLHTGELLEELRTQPTTIESLEFSPDDQYLVCGCRYEPVKIYRLGTDDSYSLPTTRRNIWLSSTVASNQLAVQKNEETLLTTSFNAPEDFEEIKLPQRSICAAWLPSGQDLVSVSIPELGTKIYTTEQPPRQWAMEKVSTGIDVLALTTVDDMIAASTRNGEVWVWRDESAPAEQRNEPHVVWKLSHSPISSIVILDQWLVAATQDGKLIRAQVPRYKQLPIHRVVDQTLAVKSVSNFPTGASWMSDGSHVLVGKKNGEVCSIAIEGSSGTSLDDATPFRKSFPIADENPILVPGVVGLDNDEILVVKTLAVSPDNKLWAYNQNSTLYVMDRSPGNSGKIVFEFKQDPRDGIASLAFSPDSTRLAWTGTEARVNVLTFTADEPLVANNKLKGRAHCLAWSVDGRKILVGGEFPTMEWDLVENTFLPTYDHGIPATCVMYSRLGDRISGHRDGTIRICEHTTNQVYVMQQHTSEVRSLILTSDDKIGFSLDNEANLGAWFVNGERIGMIAHDIPGYVGAYTMAPQAWIQPDEALKVFSHDLAGNLILDKWNLSHLDVRQPDPTNGENSTSRP